MQVEQDERNFCSTTNLHIGIAGHPAVGGPYFSLLGDLSLQFVFEEHPEKRGGKLKHRYMNVKAKLSVTYIYIL